MSRPSFVVEIDAIQESYKDYPDEFMAGYRTARDKPRSATIAKDNPYDMAADREQWYAWKSGFENYALSEAMLDMSKMMGIKLDHSVHIMLEE